MATPTSSSNRSKRKSTKPVTKGQEPQRSNRQKVSNAKVTSGGKGSRGSSRVTNASQRTNTGSAKVTGTPRPALPPGKPGGQLAKVPAPTNPRRQQAQAKAANAAKGTTGPNRVGQPAGAANRMYGANVVNGAVKRAQQTARLSKAASSLKGIARLAGPIGLGVTGADLATQAGYARGGKNYREFTRAQDKAPAKPTKAKPSKPQYQGPGGNPNGSGQSQARQTTPRVNKARQDQMRADLNRDYPLSTASQRRGATQPGGGSTQSRSGSGSAPRSSSPARQAPPKAPAKPFTGTVSEGRKLWAEKYSSSKYDGQAIQKEAKALLKKIKEEKNNQSAATRAGWDGNKNY